MLAILKQKHNMILHTTDKHNIGIHNMSVGTTNVVFALGKGFLNKGNTVRVHVHV